MSKNEMNIVIKNVKLLKGKGPFSNYNFGIKSVKVLDEEGRLFESYKIGLAEISGLKNPGDLVDLEVGLYEKEVE